MPKILVVEDEAIAAENIASRLRLQGYEVVGIVDTGAAAIATATTTFPDLVLMDIMLKGEMDGITAAIEIDALLQIPIIYMTAFTDEATLQRAKLAQPIAYLVKPFRPQELKATVEIALHNRLSRIAMHQALQEAEMLRVEAEALSSLKSDFISMVSHEFRTPLTTIHLSMDLLESQGDRWDKDKKQHRFMRIRKAVQRMNALLDDVLSVTRAESGKLLVSATEFDLYQFCLSLIEEMQLLAGDNIQINLIYKREPPICLDESLLQHILTNLLSNAIKYSRSSGAIDLEVENQRDRTIFKVRDRGIGISPEDREYLFEPFFRAKNVDKIAGTGLGLTIIKKCVDLQKGEIFIDSTLGVGTVFTVSLPVFKGFPIY
jgi:signal transduction histidine kinase